MHEMLAHLLSSVFIALWTGLGHCESVPFVHQKSPYGSCLVPELVSGNNAEYFRVTKMSPDVQV